MSQRAVDVDVVVVGGGPAGAAAAAALARAGRRVMVVDKARFPRDKCCGDGLTVAALRELEDLGVAVPSLGSWQPVEDAWLRSPSGHTVRLPLPRGRGVFAAVVRRYELDAAVLDTARAAGAEVCDGHALTAATLTGDGLDLAVEGLGTVRARYAVGADGTWSPLRHALGANVPGYLGDWHAFRQYFVDVGPAASDLWVWFEPDLLPGYAWSFPLPGGRANVGFGIQRDGGIAVREMKHLWPDLLARPQLREVLGDRAHPEGPHRAWPIPARVGRVPLVAGGGRALFVGDAAAATDPLTGEGIAQALLTGRLAALAIGAAGPDRPELAAERYEAAVADALFADHRLATVLSRALAHRKGARTAIRAAGATGWTRRNFARWLFEDYPRALLATPRRWHRGMFGGPGAYYT
ncbi:MAG TPA: geranylgeranyl reductase family protein [Acidimicrobiales bacterium]|nr:geranylgeranyl reductase family protein [Acidimicrobiales bacterium]